MRIINCDGPTLEKPLKKPLIPIVGGDLKRLTIPLVLKVGHPNGPYAVFANMTAGMFG